MFPHVYIFGRGETFAPFDRNTYVLMASRAPLNRAALDTITAHDEPSSADDAVIGRSDQRVRHFGPRDHA